MVLTYYLLNEKSTILVKMEGHLSMKNIFTAVEKIWEAPGYAPTLASIMDLREAKITSTPAEISQFAEFLIANDNALSGEFVILVNKPFETALSMVFESKMVTQLKTTIFSTEAFAIRHLNISEQEFKMLNSNEATVITIADSN